MSLQPGTTLGSYSVTAKIGEGGMGEVYQARDTKLDRDVALKVLPPAFTDDPDRLARFEREAKVLASLNHANIGGIYGLEESDGVRALVLEYIEGPTLADRIAQGPIPVDEALPIAKQIAEALEAAHEQGVIHRDLKPANIKLKPDGTVKVLDFGLAKALDVTPDGDPSKSPTMTAAATQMGVIMGTAAYMSPEQARGKPVDKRADIWAFGAVLFEMLTGRQAFEGDDITLVLAEVVKSDPALASLPREAPSAVVTVLRRCLEKEPGQRLRDIGDVRLALEGAFETPVGPATGPVATQVRVWQRPSVLTSAMVAMLAVGLVAGRLFWSTIQSSPEPVRFALTLPDSVTLPSGRGELLALSPDGRTIVYGALNEGATQLFQRPTDQFQATPIPGTEDGGSPFFSPDGEWLGFNVAWQLVKVLLDGGPPQVLVDQAFFRGADWGEDDLITYGVNRRGGGLMQVPAAGGEATLLFAPEDQRRPWYPQVIPERGAVLFTLADPVRFDVGELYLLDRETGAHRMLLPNAVAGRLLDSGHLVFIRGGALWAVPFDRGELEVMGAPAPVVEDVRIETGGAIQYATADDGTLVYVAGASFSGRRSLAWVDRDGGEELLTLPTRDYRGLSLSPDGRRAAITVAEADGRTGVWVSELTRGTLTHLISRPGVDLSPLWSPDGKDVVFGSSEDGRATLSRQAADGSGSSEPLLTGDTETHFSPWSWSPDGQTLLINATSPSTQRDVGMVSSNGSDTWEPLVQTPANERSPALSPDGRWLAYDSDESGRYEVYVQRFPDLLGRQQVSVGGGYRPRWSRDGRELLYQRASTAAPEALVRVSVDLLDVDPPVLAFGEEEVLFDWRFYSAPATTRQWDVVPDEERFLMIGAAGGTVRAEIKVVLDWTQELLERVPVD